MNKNENIFLIPYGNKMILTTYGYADFMIVRDMEGLRQAVIEEGESDTLTAINEKLLSENLIYCWDYTEDRWTEDFSDLEKELEMIKEFMRVNDIKLIEQENDKTSNKMVCNAKIGEPLNTKLIKTKDIEITKEDKETIDKISNNEKGFKIIIELKTGDKFRTTDKPLTIKEVQEAIEIFMKPNILGQKISNIDIQVVE